MDETSLTTSPHYLTFSNNTYTCRKYCVVIFYRHIQKLPGRRGSCFCIQQQWLKWIVKGYLLSVHVYIHTYTCLHIYRYKCFLKKHNFYGLFPPALKTPLFNYVHQWSGQKSNQVMNRPPAGPRAERSYSSEWPFGKELRKQAEEKVPASLSLFTFVGKWLMFARTLILKKTLSSTTLGTGLCFHCFSEESEEMKVRKHKNKTSFLM